MPMHDTHRRGSRLTTGLRQAADTDPQPQRTSRRTFVAGLVIVVLSLLSGLSTYFILTGLTPIEPRHNVVVTVLFINIVLILAMIAIIAWQVVGLWRARRRQAAAAGLHIRIVSLFSVVALLPAILLAVFASISLDRGLDQWFSSRTKSIIRDSVDVANAYLDEHNRIIRTETLSMALALDENAQLLRDDATAFQRFFAAQATLSRIPLAYLINAKGERLLQTGQSASAIYRRPPADAFRIADQGLVVDVGLNSPGGVGALRKLTNLDDAYLYVLRPVNPQVERHLLRTQANVAEYSALEQRRIGTQVAFALMYVAIALTLLLAAIWVGLWFANRLVAPIRKLISAAQRVSKGELDVEVDVDPGRNDVGQLGATFNQMTIDLRNRRKELMDANTMLDERRRFIEAVLSGVTAGVIGVDADGVITLVNRSAVDLLGEDEESLIGMPLAEAVPEFADVVTKPQRSRKKPAQTQISLIRGGTERTFAVRVTRERAVKRSYGLVVTFDDISELVVAQRTSAWADVARRIAHEIKNPLTPIQLSAERIRRKYGDAITTDREIFDRCTETIIRHVGDIGRMVDEFSDFARMPKPVFEAHNVGETVREAVILFQMGHPDIEYVIDVPDAPLITEFDRRLITQAVTNLVKNAGEAIEAVKLSGKNGKNYRGRVTARVQKQTNRYMIEVIDNGCGLPTENRHRLVEPYITTRQKGTGLGLAIVQRITEQHGGTIELEDATDGNGTAQGARVRLNLPLVRLREAAQQPAAGRRSAGVDAVEAKAGIRAEKRG